MAQVPNPFAKSPFAGFEELGPPAPPEVVPPAIFPDERPLYGKSRRFLKKKMDEFGLAMPEHNADQREALRMFTRGGDAFRNLKKGITEAEKAKVDTLGERWKSMKEAINAEAPNVEPGRQYTERDLYRKKDGKRVRKIQGQHRDRAFYDPVSGALVKRPAGMRKDKFMALRLERMNQANEIAGNKTAQLAQARQMIRDQAQAADDLGFEPTGNAALDQLRWNERTRLLREKSEKEEGRELAELAGIGDVENLSPASVMGLASSLRADEGMDIERSRWEAFLLDKEQRTADERRAAMAYLDTKDPNQALRRFFETGGGSPEVAATMRAQSMAADQANFAREQQRQQFEYQQRLEMAKSYAGALADRAKQGWNEVKGYQDDITGLTQEFGKIPRIVMEEGQGLLAMMQPGGRLNAESIKKSAPSMQAIGAQALDIAENAARMRERMRVSDPAQMRASLSNIQEIREEIAKLHETAVNSLATPMGEKRAMELLRSDPEAANRLLADNKSLDPTDVISKIAAMPDPYGGRETMQSLREAVRAAMVLAKDSVSAAGRSITTPPGVGDLMGVLNQQ